MAPLPASESHAMLEGMTTCKSSEAFVELAEVRAGAAAFYDVERLRRYVAGEASLASLGCIEDYVCLDNAARVGSGSFSHVLRAEDRISREPVALKVIPMAKLQDAGEDEERLRQEVGVMSEFRHPNLVRIYGVARGENALPGMESGPPYFCIIMQYVAGHEPLSNAIRRGGSQPQLALRVMPQLANALALIHARGVVHRDVWSENVLINQVGHVVLVDFGSAEYVSAPFAANRRLNMPYVSPEASQRRPQQPGDDAWALGLLLTEIVTGRFVAERMGRTDVPLHSAPRALSQAAAETAAIGGPVIGRLAWRLLEANAARRLSMEDLLVMVPQMLPSIVPSVKPPAPKPVACSTAAAAAASAAAAALRASSLSRTPIAGGGGQGLLNLSISTPQREASVGWRIKGTSSPTRSPGPVAEVATTRWTPSRRISLTPPNGGIHCQGHGGPHHASNGFCTPRAPAATTAPSAATTPRGGNGGKSPDASSKLGSFVAGPTPHGSAIAPVVSRRGSWVLQAPQTGSYVAPGSAPMHADMNNGVMTKSTSGSCIHFPNSNMGSLVASVTASSLAAPSTFASSPTRSSTNLAASRPLATEEKCVTPRRSLNGLSCNAGQAGHAPAPVYYTPRGVKNLPEGAQESPQLYTTKACHPVLVTRRVSAASRPYILHEFQHVAGNNAADGPVNLWHFYNALA